MRVAAFTPVCEEDAAYVDQYLAEAERLKLPYAIHLDRCSEGTKSRLVGHPLCVGFTENTDHARDFEDTDRQGPFDKIVSAGFRWALSWDIDETFENTATDKLSLLDGLTADVVYIEIATLWSDSRHRRVDGPFDPTTRQVKIYNLVRSTWQFISKLATGPRPVRRKKDISHRYKYEHCIPWETLVRVDLDLTCLHWGLMTRELRLRHKARWDRIYGKASRDAKNPYGSWDWALNEETNPAVVVEYSP